MITIQEWNQMVQHIKDDERVQSNPIHSKIVQQINQISSNILFDRSDISQLLFKSLTNTFEIKQVEPNSNVCCLTSKKDHLIGIVCEVLYPYENYMDDMIFTVHQELFVLLKSISQLGMIWYYIIQCNEQDLSPDYKAYECVSFYIEQFMKKV